MLMWEAHLLMWWVRAPVVISTPTNCWPPHRTSAKAYLMESARTSILGMELADTRDVVLGSTLATNAILERRGAFTGLLTRRDC